MGAVEHLKTLCCLGLPPESAMIAVTPLLHEIIPHGWSRMALLNPDASMSRGYAENPAMAVIIERFWELLNDPSGIVGSIYLPNFKATGIGWVLHRQGPGWLESDWYREIEAPVDSCWWLEAMIGDGGRTIASVHLTRPRRARPFVVDDVRCLDRLRPWLAHAFHGPQTNIVPADQNLAGMPGTPVQSGQMILAPDSRVIYQTRGLELLLRILARESGDYMRYAPVRGEPPAPMRRLVQQITDAANGTANAPPRMQLATAYGFLTLDAKWLVPRGARPVDVARDPKGCLISITIELREHAIAHAARVLRDGGATPAQVKVGIQLACGKAKPEIAREFGIQPSSVADLTKKLYQRLDIHNSSELGLKLWANQGPAPAVLPS